MPQKNKKKKGKGGNFRNSGGSKPKKKPSKPNNNKKGKKPSGNNANQKKKQDNEERKENDVFEIRGMELIPMEEYKKCGQTFPPSVPVSELWSGKQFEVNQTLPHPNDGKM